jgi:hypothetical protein
MTNLWYLLLTETYIWLQLFLAIVLLIMFFYTDTTLAMVIKKKCCKVFLLLMLPAFIVGVGCIIIIGIGSALWANNFLDNFATVPEHTLVLSGRGAGKVTRVFRQSQLLPKTEFDRLRLANNSVSWNPQEFQINMHVSPITENPKVRSIEYDVDLMRGGTPEQTFAELKLERKLREIDRLATLSDLVQMWLYDFQDKHSKELARFSNPFKFEQQDEFESLVRAFLEPQLQEIGLSMQGARFRLL